MFENALSVTRSVDLNLAPNQLFGAYTEINRRVILELLYLHVRIYSFTFI